ncbi:FMN-dependent NADH-azoreductase [Stappia sp. 28M-7]|jgi:FMN-dependent NADH-azoreductase|uniref:FMN-dependent NADH-azoreductase n=1 Tax=Stappia sp. 28M-7 TaxID=2762596 RepID=UPI000E75BEE0|nr:NAD(P)H-dependent oxidoreductase [Stappia sp. 28M-7]MBC2857461.1 NAD(P)H-dependent oxidoreductase [Stappia sp. 28M-7]
MPSTLKVLAITSSALGDASASNKLVNDTIDQLKSRNPDLQLTVRDLGAGQVPHLDLDGATAIRGGEPANAAQAAAQKLSDELIAEVKAADVLVIGAPMYNFGIPSTLKSWFDYVLRAGVSFRYTEAGPEGLMTGKRAIVVATRGGLYSEGPAKQMDSQEPHLRTMLNFIGITDITFVYAEKLAFGPEAREASIGEAERKLEELVAA